MKKLFLLFLILTVLGCGQSYRKTKTVLETQGEDEKKSDKIIIDAYLYDVKIKQGMKQNSFRLDIYQTDSIIGLGGRGYLGKGALKGKLTNDSIFVFFPTIDEYLLESTPDLMASFNCSGDIHDFNLYSLFSRLPNEYLNSNDFIIEPFNSKGKIRKFNIRAKNCSWLMELSYDYKFDSWRLTSFVFSDGDDTIIKGKRRKLKNHVKVTPNRFTVPIKPSSVKITL